MASNDLARIKRNVAKMVGVGAPEEDIDAYIASEGVTLEEIRAFKPEAPKAEAPKAEEKPEGSTAARSAKGLVEGVGQAGLGVIQTLAQLTSPPDIFGIGGPSPGDTLNPDGSYSTGKLRQAAEGVERRATEAVDESRARVDRLGTAGKLSALAGNVAGAIVTTPVARAPQAIKTTIAGAAALGGVEGANAPTGSGDSKLQNIAVGGATGGAVRGGTKVASEVSEGVKAIRKGFGTKTAEEWQQVGQALANQADATLKAANKTGTTVSKKATNAGIDKIVTELEGEGDLAGSAAQKLYGDTIAVLEDLKSYKNKPITLDKIHQVRQTIGQFISRNYAKPDGKADAAKATSLLAKFDDWVEGLSDKDLTMGSTENVQTLYKYLGDYSKFKRFDDFRKVVEFADGDINKVRTSLRSWFRPGAEKKLRGFTPEQIKLLRAAAFPSQGEGLLNLVGKAGVDITDIKNNGIMGPMLNLLVAGSTGISTGGATLVGASLAKMAGKKMGQGRVETSLRAMAGQ
jgi:hypothetical protein